MQGSSSMRHQPYPVDLSLDELSCNPIQVILLSQILNANK